MALYPQVLNPASDHYANPVAKVVALLIGHELELTDEGSYYCLS